jgi:outer membrane protein OmpA-like peptidoglycan-associated protein
MAAPAAAVPVGAGVVAADRQGKPSLTVYFDVGKSAVHNDLAVAAAAVKAYVAANPTAKLAVSGFNDPTGNAAANAELSKTRAQAVKAALEKLGIPAATVVLEKPADTTGVGANNAESRRVEVVVVD